MVSSLWLSGTSHDNFRYLFHPSLSNTAVVKFKNSSSGITLSSDISPSNSSDREEKLRRVRLQQQVMSNERAKAAALERKKKEADEKERKNSVAQKKKP